MNNPAMVFDAPSMQLREGLPSWHLLLSVLYIRHTRNGARGEFHIQQPAARVSIKVGLFSYVTIMTL